MNSCNMILSLAYRPPSTSAVSFIKDFESYLGILKSSGLSSIVGMDHNLDFLRHLSHRPTQDFLELIYSKDYIPTIIKPTRISYSSSTLIDNLFIDRQLSYNMTSEILIDDLSDHLPCIVSLYNTNQCINTGSYINS